MYSIERGWFQRGENPCVPIFMSVHVHCLPRLAVTHQLPKGWRIHVLDKHMHATCFYTYMLQVHRGLPGLEIIKSLFYKIFF